MGPTLKTPTAQALCGGSRAPALRGHGADPQNSNRTCIGKSLSLGVFHITVAPFLSLRWHQFCHSPADAMQSEGEIVQSGLPLGKRLCQCISRHVFCRTVDQANTPFFNDVLNEMISDINVFCAGMIVVHTRKSEGSLVVTIKRHWGCRHQE